MEYMDWIDHWINTATPLAVCIQVNGVTLHTRMVVSDYTNYGTTLLLCNDDGLELELDTKYIIGTDSPDGVVITWVNKDVVITLEPLTPLAACADLGVPELW